jgi:hypothetical protein
LRAHHPEAILSRYFYGPDGEPMKPGRLWRALPDCPALLRVRCVATGPTTHPTTADGARSSSAHAMKYGEEFLRAGLTKLSCVPMAREHTMTSSSLEGVVLKRRNVTEMRRNKRKECAPRWEGETERSRVIVFDVSAPPMPQRAVVDWHH